MRRILGVVALVAGVVAGEAGAQERGAFVLRIGSDTVAVEEYTRSARSLTGRQVVRTPGATVREYTAHLGEDGALEHFELTITRPGESTPWGHVEMHGGADAVRVRTRLGDSTRVLEVPVSRGWIPNVGYSVALYEIALARHLAAGGAPSTGHLVALGGAAQPFDLTLGARDAQGWMELANIAGPSRVRVDANGRLLAWDGSASTLKLTGERLPGVAFDALAADYMARDQAGQALGSLSPRDSVQARVGEATVTVQYGRPSARGRTIGGGVVAWDRIWRTGANQATHLRTDRDLLLGDAVVPAGTYTLFTLPSRAGWTLIVNRQTGQWGTQYDPAQDLVRIPMQAAPAADGPEQLTIAIEGGRLALLWGDVNVWIPVRER
jgi:hypothetical protein